LKKLKRLITFKGVVVENFRKELGKAIQAKRLLIGMTGKELGDIIGTTKVTMSNIESGKQKISMEMAFKIFNMLDMDIKDIYEEYLLVIK
jgi:DNA-binding XRE family transcriptional regulator